MEPLAIPEDLDSIQPQPEVDPNALPVPPEIMADPPPAPMQKPPAPDPWRLPKIAGSEFLKMLPTLPGLPSDLMAMLDEAMMTNVLEPPVNAYRSAMGMEPNYRAKRRDPGSRIGSTEFFRDPLRQAGLIDVPELQPRDTTERYVAAGARGVGAVAPLMLGNPAAALPLLTGGIGSGVGGEAARANLGQAPAWAMKKALDYDMNPETSEKVAEFAGSLAAGVPASMAGNVGQKVVNAAVGPKPDVIAKYENAGVTPRLVGDVTQGPVVQRVQEGVRATPTGAGRIERAQQALADEFEASVTGVIDRLGAAHTAEEAGTIIQKAADRWLKDWGAKSKQAWNTANTKIGMDTAVTGNATGAKINQIMDEMQGAPASLKAVMPDIQAWQRRLASDSAATGGTLRYETVKNIRTDVGGYLNSRDLVGTKADGWMKQLYGALTEDMKTAAQAAGALDEFNAANAITREGHTFLKRVINPVMGFKNAPKDPEQAYKWFKSLERSGGNRIGRTQSMMKPDEAEAVSGFRLREAAAPRPGQDTGREVSAQTFLTETGRGGKGKISPEAWEKYFQDPATRQKLEDLGFVAQQGRKSFQQAGNPSGTGRVTNTSKLISGELPAALLGYLAADVPGAFAGAAAGLGLPYAVARAVSSPTVARILATPGAYGPREGARHLVPSASGLSALQGGG